MPGEPESTLEDKSTEGISLETDKKVEVVGAEVDGLDMLSSENLNKFSELVTEDKPEGQAEDKPADEEQKVLDETPYKERAKLEEGFVHMHMVVSPSEAMPDLSKMSTQDLVDKYKEMQKVQTTRVKPSDLSGEERDYISDFQKQETETEQNHQNLVENPFLNKTIQRQYNSLVQTRIREGVSIEKAHEEGDRIVKAWQDKESMKLKMVAFDKNNEKQKLVDMQNTAAINIRTVRDMDKFKDVDSKLILQEMNSRVKRNKMTALEVVKMATKVNGKGHTEELEQFFQDSYNHVRLSNPDSINAIKEQGAREVHEKIAGGAPGGGAPNLAAKTAESESDAFMLKLQKGFERAMS